MVGEIGPGLLVFLGIQEQDTEEELEWLVQKIVGLRIFEDTEGRMNRSVQEAGGRVLLISQFTLLGNVKKGSRPSFNRAARPEEAIPLYEGFKAKLQERMGDAPACGVFGADMKIAALNDGPVTLVIDTRQRDG